MFSVSKDNWQTINATLSSGGITLWDVQTDLIDDIWPSDERDEKLPTKIMIHDVIFAGRTWSEKVNEVKRRLLSDNADMFVVTALDEVACNYYKI